MISIEKLQAQFKSFDIEVPYNLLDYCTELCLTYDVDEESFVDSWLAWTLSSENSSVAISKDLLLNFERNELKKVKTKPNVILTPTTKTLIIPESPETPNELPTPKGRSFLSTFDGSLLSSSPFKASPVGSPIGHYSNRSNSGRTVVTFGKSSFSWLSVDQEIEFNYYEDVPNSINWKYFHNTLRSWKILTDEVDQYLAKFLLEKHSLPEPSPFTILSEQSIFLARICPIDKAVIAESNLVSIEDLSEDLDSLGRIQMDISSFSDFAIFPGQVVAIKGKIVGTVMVPSKIIDNAALPLALSPNLDKHVQIIVANGPFTVSDPLNYEPLIDLLKIVKERKPNMLMLIGPILDINYFETRFDSDENLDSHTMNEYMEMILNFIEEDLKDLNINVYVVASYRDITEIPVYPTPACELFSYNKIKFICDPSFISINQIAIGVTATDTLLHIAKNDISDVKTNRFGTLSGHLIKQQTFYPLKPIEMEASFNTFLWYKDAKFPATPHILFVASELNYFVKEVEQCIVINPGKICKGSAGGTYACVEIRPSQTENWFPNSSISVKVIKI